MNKTVADARRNCDRGRTGSLAPGYTAEYLVELRRCVQNWLEEITHAQVALERVQNRLQREDSDAD